MVSPNPNNPIPPRPRPADEYSPHFDTDIPLAPRERVLLFAILAVAATITSAGIYTIAGWIMEALQ